MSKEQIQKRLQNLREFLSDWNYQYFIENKTSISEAARDKIKRELEDLEAEYPDLVTPDSPTQRIGAPLSGKFPKVRHRTQKQSLQDMFSFEELEEWEERNQRILPKSSFEYVTELKIDGLNITLWYEQGVLIRALTRGDATFGEDVTHTVRTIASIPLKLREPVTAEISGEVFMTHKSFEKLRLEGFANARNAAAGTVRQLDPQVAAGRELSAFFYMIHGERHDDQTHVLEQLKAWGLPTEAHWEKHDSLASVEKYIHAWETKRKTLNYDTDGIVIKINSSELQERLGSTARAPRWAAAYKYPAEQSTSIVEDIVLQVGRTGAVTPVAELKPTFVAGSTISRATLHNEDEIARKDVRVGDTVVIRKAGDVIPEVVEVILKLRPEDSQVFEFPKKCPVCASALVRPEGDVIHRCPNLSCPARTREQLAHFVGRGAFDIEALGEKIIDQLVEKGLVVTPADFFHLRFDDLMTLDLFETKRSENLILAIEKAKTIPLSRFLFALGIRHVGEKTARDLVPELQRALHFRRGYRSSPSEQQAESSPSDLSTPTDLTRIFVNPESEDSLPRHTPGSEVFEPRLHPLENEDSLPRLRERLDSVEGIGPKALDALFEWFDNPQHQHLLQKMSELGVRISKEVFVNEHDPQFENKTFVITGSFDEYSREELKQIVLRKGGKVSSAVTAKTDVLIVGDSPGSKLKKAQEFGTTVWDHASLRTKFTKG